MPSLPHPAFAASHPLLSRARRAPLPPHRPLVRLRPRLPLRRPRPPTRAELPVESDVDLTPPVSAPSSSAPSPSAAAPPLAPRNEEAQGQSQSQSQSQGQGQGQGQDHTEPLDALPGGSPAPRGDTTRVVALASLGAAAAAAFAVKAGLVSLPPGLLTTPASGEELLTAWNDFVQGPHFAVSLGMGLSAFVQALTGFGFAIVSVGALTQVPWIAHSSVFNAVQPVAATLGALTGWVLLLPEIKKVDWRAIGVLLVASSVTTPLGAVLLDFFDASTVIRGLGALITGYVLYSVLGVEVPKKLGQTAGAWTLGFLAGALGGAFDITGPPLVVFGEAAGWDGASGDFRRNVLAVVSVNSTLVVLWDLFSGRLNDFYYTDFLVWATPTAIVGVLVGKWLAAKLDPSTFKKVVLGTCLVMGVKLLIS